MVEDVEIITKEEYESDVYEKKHGLHAGSTVLVFTKEYWRAIRQGLVIAFNDGEYCHFIRSERKGKR